MAIQPKDVKLLWGKAASRCSMPDCRKSLVAESGIKEIPNHLIVGEMAHIVGEKQSEGSHRGMSSLPEDKRNLYSNLILLCPNHHTLVDKDVSAWTVEQLHVVKREHELWVEEKLGCVIDEQLQVYHDFIDRVAIAFNLENWEWLCDCLFREMMPLEFPDSISHLGFEHFRAIMPGKDPEFEEKLRSLIECSRSYVNYYLSDATSVLGGTRLMAKRRYREVPEDDYERKENLLEEHKKWERNCTMMLFNCVYALNEFADSVRKELRPGFFVRKGKFCVHDFMGMMGASLIETWHIPNKFFSEEELNAPLIKKANRST